MSFTVMPIEQNVPVPLNMVRVTGRPARYPWMSLAVSIGSPLTGPSFLVRCPSVEIKRLWNTLSSSARSIEKRTGKKFLMRRDAKGIRVWRIK
jgi:hypothetical protein